MDAEWNVGIAPGSEVQDKNFKEYSIVLLCFHREKGFALVAILLMIQEPATEEGADVGDNQPESARSAVCRPRRHPDPRRRDPEGDANTVLSLFAMFCLVWMRT